MRRLTPIWIVLALILAACSGDSGDTEDAATPDETPQTEEPTDDTIAQVSDSIDGVGPEDLGDGVTLDVSLLARNGVSFDPNQDVEFVVMVSIDGLDEAVVVGLEASHTFGNTEQNVDADVLRDPDSFTDGSLVEAVPSNEWWQSAELGDHQISLTGTIEPTGDGTDYEFSRDISFEVTADGPTETSTESYSDGAITVDLPRRWLVMERGEQLGFYVEGGAAPAQVDLGVDDAQMLIDLGGRGNQLTVFRLTRPLLLPDPEILVDQLPAIVGPGEFSDPTQVTVGGIEATRLSGVANGLNGTWDLVRVGHEYLMIRTTDDGTPGARDEANAVVESLDLDGDAFPRLTHRFDLSFWMTQPDGNEYFTIDLLVPANWQRAESDRGLRYADPDGEATVDLLNFPFDGPLEDFVDQAMPQLGPDSNVEMESDEVGGLDRVTARITGVPDSAVIVAIGDGEAVQVVIASNPSPDVDMALLEAIGASASPVGPPAS